MPDNISTPSTNSGLPPASSAAAGQKPFQPMTGASPVAPATPAPGVSSGGFKVSTTAPAAAPAALSAFGGTKPAWSATPTATPMAPKPVASAATPQPFQPKPFSPTPTAQPGIKPAVGAAVAGGVAGGIAGSMASKPAATPARPSAAGIPAVPTTNPGAPKPPVAGSAPTAPAGAPPKKSAFRFLPFLLLGALLVGLLAFGAYWFLGRGGSPTVGNNNGPTPANKKTITYWGLWEPTVVVQQVLADFEKENPEYHVEYVQQSYQDYRERLQAEIAKGTGPDVFRFHASWVPMMKNELSPLPEKIMTAQEFSSTFYPTATQQLTLNNSIVGIPLMIDGLGLYYNKDIFSVANRTPPKDWEELKKTAQDLTIKSGGKITRGGIAMGTASNVEHFSEIIALLMLQNGANPADATSAQALEAINTYMDYSTKLGVWDATLPNATVAFGKGDVAMMIAPSWRAHEIKAANPNLQFDIAPIPQLPNATRTTWASFWAEGVSAQSTQKEGSWLLLKYLSSAPVQQKFYSDASNVRAFGELYSRVDLADQIANKPYVGAYIQDAPYAKTWYLNAYTHDNGINDRNIKYYLDMINKGQPSVEEGVKTVQQGVNQVLTQYGVPTVQPVPTSAK